MLGYLAPFEGAAPKCLMLEVKNAGDRSFPASTAEWRRAEEQGDRYAFFVLLRGPKPRLELVPNPSELLRRKDQPRPGFLGGLVPASRERNRLGWLTDAGQRQPSPGDDQTRGARPYVAALFIEDLRRQLPRLEKQPAPVKDKDSSTGFKH